MSTKRNLDWRYLAIAAIFCLACVIYLGRLFYMQISGREDLYQSGTTTRTVTIRAVRGEIYDCNGKPLVTNRYIYDSVLPYSSFAAMDAKTSNETALQLLDALRMSGESEKHAEKFFPFDGAYPYYTLSEETADRDSVSYYRLKRVLGDVGLDKEASVAEIVDYYLETYELLVTDADGNRLFNDDDVDRLIRLRYDMDAVRFRTAGEYVLAEDVSLALMTYVRELNLKGVTFAVNAERVYNYPGYASHILGTVGPIYAEQWEYYNEQGYQMNAIVGKSGCEAAFEEYLRGSDGLMKIEVDARGNTVKTTVITEPVAGNDVRLTIDIDLQIAAEDGLAENVADVAARPMAELCNAGAAVAMDPETFAVLAIASYPTYDLGTYNLLYNELAADEAKPLLNRALNGLYEPGSTYKLGMSVAALMEEKITSSSHIGCTGKYIRYDGYSPECSTYYRGTHAGEIDVREAIEVSCNSFFYELGYRLTIDTMNRYMERFGFGEDTGLELGGATGSLSDPDFWPQNEVGGRTLQAAIGQADTRSSPLQLACYISTLCNGGTRYAAHLLHSVYQFGNDTPIYTHERETLDSFEIPADVLDTVFEGMRRVISENDIRTQFRDLPVTVGGKTGTAQNNTDTPNALFVCAAPCETPDVVISVVLESGYSGSYAAQTAASILAQYYGVAD